MPGPDHEVATVNQIYGWLVEDDLPIAEIAQRLNDQPIYTNLGEPHTKSMKDGLLELRLKGAEGIARVFYCTQVGRRIVMLHSFVKKTNRTPPRELEIALNRMKEVKHGHA